MGWQGAAAGARRSGLGECVGIAIVDAARLTAENKARYEELQDRHTALRARTECEERLQAEQRRAVYDGVLTPFRDAFSRLKNVDLVELAELVLLSGAALPMIEVTQVRLASLGAVGALTGGVTSGAGAGAAAYMAVGAFAAASTGTPIAALSGVAATNATLAFLGGGSLAAGGGGIAAGTVVLGGVVVAPVLLAGVAFVSWKGRSARRSQQQVSASLDVAEADLDRAERRVDDVLYRSRQVRGLLVELEVAAREGLPRLVELIGRSSDYAAYTSEERADIAAVVGLMTATVGLMGTPLVDGAGVVSDLSAQAVVETRSRLIEFSKDGRA